MHIHVLGSEPGHFSIRCNSQREVHIRIVGPGMHLVTDDRHMHMTLEHAYRGPDFFK